MKTKATSVHKSGLGEVEGVMVNILVNGIEPNGPTIHKWFIGH